ncbi:MAG: lipopolysaccharide biosynthesis protein, partial [Chlorobi bacterium]|nr:lipopolysaccharide biosynthesis protein [Chlorobiota bacterium]
MEDLKQKSIKAFVWDFSGKIANQFVSFIVSIFLARLLSPEDFGMLAMINVIIMLSSGFINMGLGEALIQKKNINDKHYGSVFFFNIVVGITLSGLLFVFAPLIGKFYNNSDLIPITRTMSLLFIFNSFGNVIRVKLRKDLNYNIPTKAGLISSFISGIIGIAMAFTGFGVWSLVVQSLLNPVIANLYLFTTVKWKPVLQFKWHALKDLWSFGFRMFLSGIINTIFVNLDSIIIGKLFSAGTLGFYYRARSLNNYIIKYSSASLMSVLLPALSKVQDDLKRFKSIVRKSYHLIALIAFFLTGFFFVTGSDFIILLFGEKWLPTVSYFQIIIITGFAYPLSSLLVTILSASGNSKAFLKLEIIKKIFFGISLTLGFIWGVTGFLICNAFVIFINFYLNIIFAG